MTVWLGVSFALAFAFTNGFNDAASTIATLVATRGAPPGQAALLSAVFNMLGAVLVTTAVAGTIAGIVTVPRGHAVSVISSGVLAATLWNLATWWRGLPSSSSHALVGGLAGAGLAEAGLGAIRWGGLHGWRPVGVFGVLIGLALSPLLGLACSFIFVHASRRPLRRATRGLRTPIRSAGWAMSAALSFSHGANDAQKSMGVIAALLVADGRLNGFSVPLWAKLGCGVVLALGTSMGGWRIVQTVGRRIVRLAPVDGLASQTASTGVILAASYAGAPVSTSHVVAASVVGVGVGKNRWRHVHWAVVRTIVLAWLVTLPAAATGGAAIRLVWGALA